MACCMSLLSKQLLAFEGFILLKLDDWIHILGGTPLRINFFGTSLAPDSTHNFPLKLLSVVQFAAPSDIGFI